MTSEVRVGLSPTPVFIDGLSSTLSYVILAVKDRAPYNCVVYGQSKIKFYPDAAFWGISDDRLYRRIDNYQGIHGLTQQHVLDFLKILRGQRATYVAPVYTSEDFELFNKSQEDRAQNSRRLHPSTGGGIPEDLPVIEDLPLAFEEEPA